MSASAQFTNVPLFGAIQTSTALTGTKAVPTNASLLLTLPKGFIGLLNWVRGVHNVTSTAGKYYFWLYDGTTYFAISEIVVPAVTITTSLAGFDSGFVTFNNGQGIPLDAFPNGSSNQWKVYGGVLNAESCNLMASAGTF